VGPRIGLESMKKRKILHCLELGPLSPQLVAIPTLFIPFLLLLFNCISSIYLHHFNTTATQRASVVGNMGGSGTGNGRSGSGMKPRRER
jgi:hypothetical protein